jgi:hypothetical protein
MNGMSELKCVILDDASLMSYLCSAKENIDLRNLRKHKVVFGLLLALFILSNAKNYSFIDTIDENKIPDKSQFKFNIELVPFLNVHLTSQRISPVVLNIKQQLFDKIIMAISQERLFVKKSRPADPNYTLFSSNTLLSLNCILRL